MKLLALIPIVLLTGCTFGGVKPEVPPPAVDIQDVACGVPQKPPGLNLKPVEPLIISDKFGVKWVALTFRHYDHLGNNFAEITAHIKGRVALEQFWTDCIADYNKRAKARNAKE